MRTEVRCLLADIAEQEGIYAEALDRWAPETAGLGADTTAALLFGSFQEAFQCVTVAAFLLGTGDATAGALEAEMAVELIASLRHVATAASVILY